MAFFGRQIPVVAVDGSADARAEEGGSAEFVRSIFRPSGVEPGTASDSEMQFATEISSLSAICIKLKFVKKTKLLKNSVRFHLQQCRLSSHFV